MPNIAISCQCGWVGIAPTYSQAVTDHLYHQMYGGMGHSALNMTVVPEHMGHCELSIFRQVAHQDGLDYRAKQQVKSRKEYVQKVGREMRISHGREDLLMIDDGLGCARGLVSALAIMATGLIVALCVWAVWIR